MVSQSRQHEGEHADQVVVQTNGVGNHPKKVKIVKEKPVVTTGWRHLIKPNRELIPLKIFILFFYGGVAALYPYLVIHMKSLGITVTQTGLMYTIYPICVCVGAPLAGIIGDKSGKYKLTLIIFLTLGIVLHVLLLFAVPKYQVITEKFPEHITQVDINVSCMDLQEDNHHVITGSSLLSSNTSLQSATCDASNVTTSLVFDNCLWTCSENVTYPKLCMATSPNAPECFTLEELTRMGYPETAWLDVSTGPLNSHGAQIGKWSINSSKAVTCQSPDSDVTGCRLSCQARTDVVLPCLRKRTEGSQFKTFAIYLAIRLSCGLALSLSFTLADASLIQMVEDYNGDIGINRAWSYVGFTAVPPLSGLLLDYASKIRGVADYAPAFYIFAACHFLAVTVLCFMDLNVRPPAKNVMAGAAKLLKYPRVVAFVTIFCIIGLAWGFLETFLFWLLEEDLKTPKWLLGFTNTVGGLAGVPFCILATTIIKYTGYSKIFIFGIFVFGLRFLGYAAVTSIAWVLPLECLEAFTSSLPMTAASIYASTFSADLLATLQGINGALHFGIGRGLGSLMGGLMIEAMGTRKAFGIFGCVCISYSIVHSIAHFVWLRGSPKPRRRTDKAPAEQKLMMEENGGAFLPEEESKDDKNVNYPDGTTVSPFSLMAPSSVALGSFMHIDAVGRTSRRGSNISVTKQDIEAVRRGRHASVDMTPLRSIK